ncbi:MAG: L-threonylcarbamoyladenylate synthase [Patescibacteria group bacterium]|nr:L-threonylcarbamoyladenylate synthase [Patescibacteria group bacterium]
MKVLKLTSTNQQEIIKQTVATLKSGGLVVFPSDTVYGLLADAANPEAVSKLLAFKERQPGKAISIFVADKDMAEKYVELNQNGQNVIKNLTPGPFTVIAKYKNKEESRVPRGEIDQRLLAENGTLGIRIPDYPLILNLIKEFDKPTTATSANISSSPPHYSIESFLKSLLPKSDSARSPLAEFSCLQGETLGKKSKKLSLIDLIVDAGELPHNKPSTVIDTTTGQLKTLRPGNLLPKTPNSLISNSEKETKELGRFLATKLLKKCFSKAIVFLLEGELGTGKTIFTKGLAEALGIQEEIISPTYTIFYEYQINLPKDWLDSLKCFDTDRLNQNISVKEFCPLRKLVHFDLYRIETPEELKEIGFFDNLVCGNLCVIEWAERLPKEAISAIRNTAEIVYIKLKHSGINQREIEWGFSAEEKA